MLPPLKGSTCTWSTYPRAIELLPMARSTSPRRSGVSSNRRDLQTEASEAALRAAKAQGCVCQPDLRLAEFKPGLYSVTLAHDEWCPLLRARKDRN